MPTPPAETAGPAPAGPRRHDPFLLPSATSIRFSLLILVAAVASMYLTYWFVPVLPLLGLDATGAAFQAACVDQVRADADRASDQALLRGYADCVATGDRQVLLWMVVPGPAWAGLTLVVHALHPLLLRRRLRPVPLPRDDGALAVRREVDAALDGARKRVTLLATRGTAGGARVFGAFGRYTMAVDTSLMVLREDGRLDDRALAVIRHEAAHLRNRDVDITYLTMASWWAFVLFNTGPLAFYAFAGLYDAVRADDTAILLSSAVPGTLLLAVTLFLLQAARARILRTREHYADVRAARTPDVGPGLRRLLSWPQTSRGGSPPRRWWRSRREYHPTHRSRVEVLDDPGRLSAVSRVDLAVAGLALSAAHLHLSAAGAVGSAQGSEGGVLTATLLGVPVGALVTAIVWNAVHAAPEAAHRWRGAATALTAGLLLGLLPPVQIGVSWFALLWVNPLSAVVSVFGLWALCLLFLRWSALCAGAWLATSRRRRAAFLAGTAVGAAVFGCGFGIWVHFNGILGAEAAGGWVGLLGAPVAVLMASWRFPAAVALATVFAFVGLVRGARAGADRGPLGVGAAHDPAVGGDAGSRADRGVLGAPAPADVRVPFAHGVARRPPPLGVARRPLVPLAVGCALAGLYAVLLLGTVAVGLGGGTLSLLLVLFAVVVAAVAGSFALGVWSGGRNAARGTAPCLAAVAVLTVLVLEPLVYATVFDGTVCLLSAPPASCPGATVRAVSAGYADAVFARVGLPVLLLLCGAGAALGARLRSAAGTGGSARDASPGVAWRRRHTVAVLAAAAAAAGILGSAVLTVARQEAPRVEAEARPGLAAQVEPATLSPEQTCAKTEGSMDLRVDDAAPALLSSGAEDGAVTLASSSDPVLAAFGRAALDRTGVPSGQLFDAVRTYCQHGNTRPSPP